LKFLSAITTFQKGGSREPAGTGILKKGKRKKKRKDGNLFMTQNEKGRRIIKLTVFPSTSHLPGKKKRKGRKKRRPNGEDSTSPRKSRERRKKWINKRNPMPPIPLRGKKEGIRGR